MHLILALLWSATVFVSFCGFGAALLRLLHVRPELGSGAAAGVALLVCVGGCLNLAHAVNPLVLRLLVFAGMLLCVALRPKLTDLLYLSGPRDLIATVLLLLSISLLGLRLVATVRIDSYQNSDDYGFYMAAPEKMMELSYYAPDPYSERRIINNIGGGYFLQGLTLAWLPIENLQMADRFTGALLLALASVWLARSLLLSRRQTLVLLLSMIVVPQLQFNLTMVVLPSALFLAMVAIGADAELRDKYPAVQAALMGAVAGAAASTKSNYIVHATVLLVLFAVLRTFYGGLRQGGRFLAFSGLAGLLVLLPWSIASHHDSGTYFYPLLGHGFHYTAYHMAPSPSGWNPHLLATKVFPFTAVLVLLAAAQAALVQWRARPDETEVAPLLMGWTAVLGTLVLGVATGGDSIRRYNYPVIIPAVLLLFASAAARARRTEVAGDGSPGTDIPFARVAVLATASLSLLLCFYIGLNSWTREFRATAHSLRDAFSSRPALGALDAAAEAEYARVEQAIPASGGAALITTHYNYLFNFRERPLFLADFAGAAGPPPGWPAYQSGDALARYLLANGVRYLVFNYAFVDFATTPDEEQHALDNSKSLIIRNEMFLGFKAFRQYRELASSRKRLYDDGQIFVLDLAEPAQR